MHRRDFLTLAAAARAPARARIARRPSSRAIEDRPGVPCGVATGDVTDGQAIVWSRIRSARAADRRVLDDALVRRHPPRRRSGGARRHRLHRARRSDRPACRPAHLVSRAVSGSRRSAPLQPAGRGQLSNSGRGRCLPDAPPTGDVSFTFSGDCVGQGWGIDPVARRHAALRRDAEAAAGRVHPPRRHHLRRPAAEAGGRRWTTDRSGATSSPRRSRGRRRRSTTSGAATATTCRTSTCGASTPRCRRSRSGTITRCATTGIRRERLDADPRADVKSVALLAARAKRAFLEYLPLRINPIESERIYRAWRHGPALEVFALDMRSYRGAELGQPPADADGGVRDPRRRAARVARARAGGVHIHVEGDRVRHAAGGGRAGRRRRVRSGREPRARRAARPRARDRATAEVHQGPQNPQRRVADGGRALLRRASLQPGARALHRVRSVLGVRRRDRCTPAPSARASSIGRSVPR